MKTLRRKKCPGQILFLLVACLQPVCWCLSARAARDLSGHILDSYYQLLLLTYTQPRVLWLYRCCRAAL
jgi:hypothetical protein